MKIFLRWLGLATVLLFPYLTWAAGANVPLDKAPINLGDKASLQRGAKYFMNYCQGCHSLKYMRYNRLAADLGIVDDKGNIHEKLLRDNLIFSEAKPGDTIEVALTPQDAEKWFGLVPPDLTLVARSRGPDWIYTYLRDFYVDKSKPWGVNNLLLNDTAMPHMLANMQGEQVPVYRTETIYVHGKAQQVQVIDHLKLAKPGSLSPQQYDRVVADLVNFLAYVAEPMKIERQRIGIWVMLYLVILLVLVYFLKKAYWKKL